MIKLENFDIDVVRMNKASLVVRIDGEDYLVTRNVFNKIASKQATTIFVVEKEYRGTVNKWLALPSIFQIYKLKPLVIYIELQRVVRLAIKSL